MKKSIFKIANAQFYYYFPSVYREYDNLLAFGLPKRSRKVLKKGYYGTTVMLYSNNRNI